MNHMLNFVGLKYTGAPVPKSGMYINSLPGITSQMLDYIAEPEQMVQSVVWKDVQDTAYVRFYSDITSRLRAQYELISVKEFIELKVSPNDIVDMVAQVPGFKGIKIKFGRHKPTFEAVIISKVYFRSSEARNAEIRVLNALNQILYEKQVAVIEGVNEIGIDEIFADDELFIGVDGGPEGWFDTSFNGVDASCYCMTVRACRGVCEPTMYGASVDQIGGTLTGTNKYNHGVGFEGSLVCDYGSLIANNKQVFLNPWFFLLGNQLLIELLGSSRVNQFTTVDREQYEGLRDHYQVEYERAIDTVIKGIRMHDSCCVKCAPLTKQKTWLP